MPEKTAVVLSIYPDGSIKDDSQDLKLGKASSPKAAEKYCKEAGWSYKLVKKES